MAAHNPAPRGSDRVDMLVARKAPISKVLSRLDGVRQTAADRWVARCPAHDDSSPSLAIRELPNGELLIHDFAGCSTERVLDAIGLEFADLFPRDWRPPADGTRPIRRPWRAIDVLHVVAREAEIASAIAEQVAFGDVRADVIRLALAAERLRAAVELADG